MDNEDLNHDNEYESSTPSWISGLLLAALVLACGVAIYFAQRDPGNRACVQNDLTLQAQSAVQKANMEYQTACIRRDQELRLKVLQACVDKGNIPVLVNGNIDCKPSPK